MSTPAAADASSAIAWLSVQAQSNGSISTAADIALPLQSTSEALRALSAASQSGPAYAAAQQFIAAEPYTGAEFLSRKIIAAPTASQGPLTALLLTQQNTDSAFGEFLGYQSTSYDTAFALNALGALGLANASVSTAISALTAMQNADGSWGDPTLSSSVVYPTALALEALASYRNRYNVTSALTKARTYLMAHRNADGLWGDTFVSAQALIGILPTLTDRSSIAGALTALQARQHANGSFEEDVFSTALASRALLMGGTPNADEIVIRGRIIDADTQLPLSGVTIALSGPKSISLSTGSTGTFEIHDATTGAYTISFSLNTYRSSGSSFSVVTGQTVDFGAITLTKDSGNPANIPTTGTVKGVITDASGMPLPGVAVTANGSLSTITAMDGSYIITNIPAGAVSMSASLSGYGSATGSGNLFGGGILLFSPKLVVVTQSDPGNGIVPGWIQGTVTDADTGNSLQGATVAISGSTTTSIQTDAQGKYRIDNLTPGDITVTISLSGYQTVIATTRAANNNVIAFSPTLYKNASTPPVGANTSSVTGQVVDSSTNQPIANPDIYVRTGSLTPHAYWRLLFSSSQSASYVTLAEVEFHPEVGAASNTSGGAVIASGHFSATTTEANAFDGNVTSRWSSNSGLPNWVGYHYAAPVRVVEYVLRSRIDTNTEYPKAWTLQYSDNGTAWTTLDSRSGQSFSLGEQKSFIIGTQVQTNADGSFTIPNVTTPDVEFSVLKTGYHSVDFALPVEPLANIDIGQVRLRSVSLDTIVPDLTVTSVSAASSASTSATDVMSGMVDATVRNVGTAAAGGTVQLVAFYDANFNGQYDADVDVKLGQSSVNGLAIDATTTVTIPVSGSVPFRDPPVSVAVNPDGSIFEEKTDNNVASSGKECLRPAGIGTFTPKLKWQWSGTTARPTDKAALAAPVVAPLIDTNGDGKIDQNDIPAIIFVAHVFNDTTGYLTAINGATGATIWQANELVNAWASPAVADIDGDGLMEIVVGSGSGSTLMAYENTGVVKWSVPTGYSSRNYRDNPAIADLDGDGSPEIIFGAHVFHANGQLAWIGTGDQGGPSSYSYTPIVADVDMDGVPNVVAGRTLYDNQGHVMWTAPAVSDGYNAVGNFNDDPYPEIVLVASSKVYLIDHLGHIIWGPVAIPGGGTGGPPTVADMNGDGKPEIGVAGSSKYTVFKADGSVLWSATTQDVSSNQTGSSVFDLDGDGHAEVLYNDELHFFIYDGATGAVKSSIVNSSGTVLEYPVVADIDHDGHAEILVISDSTSTSGVRAFEGVNDDWMATRSIWNEHSYHITNVNDDGTVPAHELNSWQTTNTYRLNTFLGASPLEAPDLSASDLRIIDNGAGQPLSVQARVGNGGANANPAGLTLGFYDGDPAAGGVLLGTVAIPVLEPGRYADLRLDGVVSATGAHDIYAWADSANALRECNENNNMVHRALSADMQLGTIGVATDAPSYQANTSAQLSGILTNTGRLAGDYTSELVVEDLSGGVVVRFPVVDAGIVASGQSVNRSEVWNTEESRAGSYRLRGTLRDASGNVVAESTTNFDVLPGAIVADLRVNTDRAIYSATDLVRIGNLARNLASNYAIPDASLHLVVTNPSGVSVLTQDIPLGELAPAGLSERSIMQSLLSAVQGTYNVAGELRDGTGQVLATAHAQYLVVDDLLGSLKGTVTAQTPVVTQGQAQTCVFDAQNPSSVDFSGVQLRMSMAALDVDATLMTETALTGIGALSTQSFSRTANVANAAPGNYMCALEVFNNGDWRPLAHAQFQVAEEALQVTDAVVADKAVYDTTDQALLTSNVRNLALYHTATQAVLRITVTNANGVVQFGQDLSLGDVGPEANLVHTSNYSFAGTAEGTYGVVSQVLSATGQVLASANTSYDVVENLARTVTGSVSVELPNVQRGQPESCTDTLRNAGVRNLAGLPVRQSLLRLDISQLIGSTTTPVNLAAGAIQNLIRPIATAPLSAGSYACKLEAQIDGSWVDFGSAGFTVTEEPPHVVETISVDKPVYTVDDSVQISDSVKNLTTYRVEKSATLQLRVTSSTGTTVYSSDIVLGDLAPGSSTPANATYAFTGVTEGTYLVHGYLLNGAGELIASAQAQYEVKASAGQAIHGSVAVNQASIHQGDVQSCTDTVSNSSLYAVNGLAIRQVLERTDVPQTINTSPSTINVPGGGSKDLIRSFSTSSLAVGDYSCRLDAQIDNQWTKLGSAAFHVDLPSVSVSGSMGMGDKGRLLVLMDSPSSGSSGGSLCTNNVSDVSFEVDFDHSLSPSAVVTVNLYNWLGLLVDTETVGLRSATGEVNLHPGLSGPDLSIPSIDADSIVIGLAGSGAGGLLNQGYKIVTTVTDPLGNFSLNSGLFSVTCNTVGALGDVLGSAFKVIGINGATHSGAGIGDGADSQSAAVQVVYLQSLLNLDGWSYDIVTDKNAFATKMRSGSYQSYALLSEYVTLDEQIQKELRENVFGNAGLLNAGRHDVRRRILDKPLGVQYSGYQLAPQGVQMLSSSPFLSGQSASFSQGNQVQRFSLKGATTEGNVIVSGSTQQPSLVTRYAYGSGHSALGGYDMLAEATANQQTSGVFSQLIRQPLLQINPPQSAPLAGRVVPVRLSISNPSIADTTTAAITASAGAYITNASAGTVSTGALAWSTSLAAGQTKTVDVWVQLPSGNIPVTLTAVLNATAGAAHAIPVTVTYALTPAVRPTLTQAISDLLVYVSQQQPSNILGAILDPILGIKTPAKAALDDLNAANADLANGNVEKALKELIEATDYLINDGAAALTPIRLTVDEAIYQTQKLQ